MYSNNKENLHFYGRACLIAMFFENNRSDSGCTLEAKATVPVSFLN